MTFRVSVDRLARILRLLDADMQGSPEQERREAIADEIARAVEGETPDRRAAMLDALRDGFPVDTFIDARAVLAAAPAPDQAATAAPAGAAGAGGAPRHVVEQFAKALGLPEASIDDQRLLELSAMWMQFTLAIDTAVRTVWREISKHASTKALAQAPAPAAILGVAASYMKGEPRTGAEEVQRQLELLRRLISGMLMGLADAAKQHAQEHARVFAPDAIRNTVTPKKLENRETACWRHYESLVDAHHVMDIQAVFGTIQKRLAEYVIQTMAASGPASGGTPARG